jgi:ribosomal protein S27E
MAYITCPECRVPQQVSDDAARYQCFGCYSDIVFETCTECGFVQAIPSRAEKAFTCGHCEQKVDLPFTREFSTTTKAKNVQGYGFTYPRF